MKFTTIPTALACVMGLAAPALAQSDIHRPECVAPANPGGGFDLTCRVAQTGLQSHVTDPVQVTFMPGGIGAVAFNQFNTNRSDDGSAIVAFSTGSLLNIITGKYGAFDENSVRWVATAGADFGAVVVRADSEYQSLKDVMDDLAADPQSVVVGAGGSVGSQDWMKGALLMREAGGTPMQMRYVAFDGGGDAIASLLGGSIEVYTGDVGEMVPYLDSGDMRILATLAPERLDPPFDQIPTAKEQGYDVEWTILRGFYMGGETSDEDYAKWVDAFEAAYATEEFAKVQTERGLLPLNIAGDELSASIQERVKMLREVATEAGLIQ
ncbi:tripartite tricarboxylate transporter substrate-binding protein [Paracoccus sp. 1_MG-2023]|uniref:Bug family tripartite tricarboxylate transporter substrate binding protein n=1 Tax=unclassified Paracoccus (in: a-proteobacteria) TaxID=2688777 RepID=UPI001C08EBBE|nr:MULTISPECIES: tripartite tricarboxylate transporter substrate-binding protein [unclassified Paracoccus (in: a-proteobacteria)]MBU2957992.1 tripartite tricarboxylate transporter substrate binding protein [Paracoccus sp. C2R09]MDO6668814.1 tripartite tricarboxylate transporter substrate-binding protein [Paracoccus sp. 1_MG-2023]